MQQDPAIEHETVCSFLASLDPGGHASVCLEAISPEEALRLCEEAAPDTRERVLVANRDIDFSRLRRQDLLDLLSTARVAGARGLLIVVHGDHALERDRNGHVASEHALGADLPAGVRILCFYTRRSQHDWQDVLPAHRVRLDARAWQVA